MDKRSVRNEISARIAAMTDCEKARESASKTIAEVKKIMGIHYF